MAQGSGRRGRIFIYVALILILGVVLIYALMKFPITGLTAQQSPTQAPEQPTVPIVVTTQSLARGAAFTEAVLTTIPYPKESVPAGLFYNKVADVVGKRAKTDLDAQTPVTSSMVAEDAGGSASAFQIPRGMVAVSVPISRLSSVSYAVRPGDHVNVMVTALFVDVDQDFQSRLPNHTASVTSPGPCPGECPSSLAAVISSSGDPSLAGRAELDPTLSQPVYVVPQEVQRPRMVTQTLLQDVIVLQVGTFPADVTAPTVDTGNQLIATPAPQGGETPAVATAPVSPDVITLIVAPQDALTLNYLMALRSTDANGNTTGSAQMTLALRSAGDDQRAQTEAVTMQYLMEQYNIPLPAKQPYGLEPHTGSLTPPWVTGNDTIPNPQ